MQPVNDDMEDLFRRAAESYPLKSDGADFNKISQMLGSETVLPEKKDKKRNLLWLLLLLLIPVAILLRQNYTTKNHADITHNNDVEKPGNKNMVAIKETIHKISDANTTTRNDPSTTQIAVNDDNKKQVTTTIKNNQPEKTQPEKNISVNHPDKSNRFRQNSNTYTTLSSRHTIRKDNGRNNQLIIAKNKRENRYNINDEPLLGFSKRRKTKKVINDTLIKESAKQTDEKTAIPLFSTSIKESFVANQERNTTDSFPKANPAKKPVDSSAIGIAKLSKKIIDTTTDKVTSKNSTHAKPSIYVGITGGPDASTVKSNKASKAGYNIGFVAGYNTGRHLRFETGILWNDKKYYSDGRNITTDKLALPQHSSIVYLNGTCGMIEIPVSIQYHFNTKGKHTWYAGTGLSSYIMKKEGYDYLYSRYNVEYYSKKEYKNSTTNWLSVWQFDIGYQVKINKAINLRIEPYARLPLHGLGIGKLPLSSVGINAGFTLPVH